MLAPPIVAAGFLWLGALQIAGAALSTAALWLLAWVVMRHVVPTVPRPAAILFTVSSVAVLVPMLLALQWAVGHNLGTPALSIQTMARTHGLTNALAFTLPALLAWHLTPEQPDPPPPPAAGDKRRRYQSAAGGPGPGGAWRAGG